MRRGDEVGNHRRHAARGGGGGGGLDARAQATWESGTDALDARGSTLFARGLQPHLSHTGGLDCNKQEGVCTAYAMQCCSRLSPTTNCRKM